MKILIIPVAVCCAFLSGCGNSWEVTKKTFKSDFGSLSRRVRVYDSRTKETVWEYTGPVYVTEGSKPSDISLVYRDSAGKFRKNDFIGESLSIVMLETDSGK